MSFFHRGVGVTGGSGVTAVLIRIFFSQVIEDVEKVYIYKVFTVEKICRNRIGVTPGTPVNTS